MDKLRIGIALTGSFCTLSTVLDALAPLRQDYELFPVMSPIVYHTDTRFGTAAHFKERLQDLCEREIWHTIPQVEPIGPKNLLDCLVIAPCTANTLAKLALGVADTAVTMAAKSTLRNNAPVLIALSTNDALSGAAKNIGALQSTRNYYFVPYGQDDPFAKNRSCIAKMELLPEALKAALEGRQLQPILQ
jgi:dipicolinate synthase subunit B